MLLVNGQRLIIWDNNEEQSTQIKRKRTRYKKEAHAYRIYKSNNQVFWVLEVFPYTEINIMPS
jgi:hypothetical protein